MSGMSVYVFEIYIFIYLDNYFLYLYLFIFFLQINAMCGVIRVAFSIMFNLFYFKLIVKLH